MKRILLYGMLLILLPLRLMAQGEELTIRKGDCMPSFSDDGDSHRASRRLPKRKTDWDADKTYKQLVILFSFSDFDFEEEHSWDFYNSILNKPDYNEGNGVGCVADYYRAQSGGLFNLQFDIYGPYEVSQKAQPYDNPTSSTKNYGRDAMLEATQLFVAEHPEIDFSEYDWNGNGYVNQVVFIYAGYGGNTQKYGYIWPNTGSFSAVETPDGKKISSYTASAELWPTSPPRSCGIGTICHEFSHTLGLPDIYPIGNNLPYSAVDEWDLMDGGNFTNYGWCPPNFSPLEKMLLGWLTPVELKDATTITDMKITGEGGPVYQIKHTDNEYLLLENRQWKGWDLGIPGKGLVVYSVNFEESAWTSNRVNSFSDESQFHYRLIHADNLTYAGWEDKKKAESLGPYQKNSERMNKTHLSTSPYPYQSNDSLTNTSIPAAQMQTENVAGETLLSNPITNIHILDDGIVSFEFNEATQLLVEGNESSEGGMVSKSTTVTEGKKTLTIIPNKGYYVEAKNISVLARDLLTGEKEVEITALDVSADPSGTTQYTYSYEEGYGYQIIVDFQKCIDFSKDETKPVITIEATSFEYDGTKKEPAVLSVIYGDGVLVDKSNYDVTYENNIEIGDAKVIITGKRCFIGECRTTFTIKEATSINIVSQSVGDERNGIYDLQGHPVQTPMSGQVYIIRKKDGPTRKQIQVGAK